MIEAFMNAVIQIFDIRYGFLRKLNYHLLLKIRFLTHQLSEYYGPYEDAGFLKLTKILS